MRNSGRSRLTRRQFLSLAAAAAALPALPRTATAQQPRRTGRHLHLGEDDRGAEPRTRSSSRRSAASGIDPLFYNRLVEWGADGKLEPALAESWTTSPDGKTWTFKLRRGVKFHNGREFVADDVKFTYERVLDPKVGSGGRGYLLAIDGIETPDKYTRADPHQGAERLAPGRHGGRLVVDRPAGRRREAAATCAGPRSGPGRSSSRSGCRRATSRRGRTPTTGTRASRTSTPSRSRSSPTRRTSSPSSAPGNIHHALLEDNKNYLLVKDDKRLTALRVAAARLRHGDHQPRAEAVRRRPRAPGDQPGRRPHRGAAGGGVRARAR